MFQRNTLTTLVCLVGSLTTASTFADTAHQPAGGPAAIASGAIAFALPAAAPVGTVLFDNDSAHIDQSLWPVLRTTAALAVANPQLIVELEGHTDVRGSRNHNHVLSFRRVQAVRKFLIRHGVAPDRITTIGFGETRASANINDTAGQSYDRRVSIALAANGRPA